LPSVVVSVKDTGVGIPEENLDKILDPFFSTKPVGKGTGLGLSLCFGIIEAHGGRFEIKSEPGKGTEIKVLLPVKIPGKE
jgi:two-component system NtrC family sensor kinase